MTPCRPSQEEEMWCHNSFISKRNNIYNLSWVSKIRKKTNTINKSIIYSSILQRRWNGYLCLCCWFGQLSSFLPAAAPDRHCRTDRGEMQSWRVPAGSWQWFVKSIGAEQRDLNTRRKSTYTGCVPRHVTRIARRQDCKYSSPGYNIVSLPVTWLDEKLRKATLSLQSAPRNTRIQFTNMLSGSLLSVVVSFKNTMPESKK